MTECEKAAFFEELCSRGIALYEAAKDGDCEHTCYARKIRTFTDERVYLNAEATILGFGDRDAAITFLKTYIDWEFQSTPDEVSDEVTPPPSTMYEFQVIMMVDLGFGPQKVNLGKVGNNCNEGTWQEDVQEASDKLGKAYILKHHPDKEWNKLSKQVGFIPAPHPA